MVVLTDKRKLLWIGPEPLPSNVSLALSGRWDIRTCISVESLSRRLEEACVVLIAPRRDELLDPRRLSRMLDQIDLSAAVGVVLVPVGMGDVEPLAHRRGQFVVAEVDAPPGELAARIETAADLQPAIRDLRADIAAGLGPGSGAERTFDALQEEMRLAASLQRDFLPHSLPHVKPVRFATLFRPASWVSGDFYDVFRLDETHVGFYVADVAGHGLPAALLTMFVKKALQTKQIVGNSYEIIPPEQVLGRLNIDICEQNLSSCQFCTVAYAVVDAQSLLLRYARGGHPCPLLLRADGRVEYLTGSGPLLGIFPDEAFQPRCVALAPGDRVVMYSDGTEHSLSSPAHPGAEGLTTALQQLREAPPQEMVLQLTSRINERRTQGKPDDVTILVMDVEID